MFGEVMILSDPQNYFVELRDAGGYELSSHAGRCKFSGTASTQKTPKLYTVSHDGELLYVGIARRSMAARLSHGLNAVGLGGYHGYKWKFLRHRLDLSVWTAKLNGAIVPLQDLEIVEAEIAFFCRQAGQWPAYQHEIHFRPSAEMHRSAATQIYRHAVTRADRPAAALI